MYSKNFYSGLMSRRIQWVIAQKYEQRAMARVGGKGVGHAQDGKTAKCSSAQQGLMNIVMHHSHGCMGHKIQLPSVDLQFPL